MIFVKSLVWEVLTFIMINNCRDIQLHAQIDTEWENQDLGFNNKIYVV